MYLFIYIYTSVHSSLMFMSLLSAVFMSIAVHAKVCMCAHTSDNEYNVSKGLVDYQALNRILIDNYMYKNIYF